MEDNQTNFKGRQFICSCGKNYLSYAALFTHIKQKHDGKAPGPITRPRSERKRGRPRKNPQAENQDGDSDSDKQQNGIFKTPNINNIVQKEQDQEKTKKAAQLLGCGGFVAFTAYKPDAEVSSPRKLAESGKKMSKKKCSISSIQRKNSKISIQKQVPVQSQPNIENLQQQKLLQQFILTLQQRNNQQFLQLLKQVSTQTFKTTNIQKIKSHLLSSIAQQKNQDDSKQKDKYKQRWQICQVGLKDAICMFMGHFRKYIEDKDEQVKLENRQQDDLEIVKKRTGFQNVLGFFAAVLDCFGQNYQSIGLQHMYDLLPGFAIQSLPTIAKSYNIPQTPILTPILSVRLLLFFQNFITLSQISSTIPISHPLHPPHPQHPSHPQIKNQQWPIKYQQQNEQSKQKVHKIQQQIQKMNKQIQQIYQIQFNLHEVIKKCEEFNKCDKNVEQGDGQDGRQMRNQEKVEENGCIDDHMNQIWNNLEFRVAQDGKD